MERVVEIIKQNTELPFGFCPYSLLQDRLLDCRAKLRLPQNAKTVICFLFPYKVKEERPKNISRYAAVPDYHDVCGNILNKITDALKTEFPENEFSFFIDNSPIPEVAAAAAAGLGVRGENGLLLTEKYGSFVFIGEIVTDLSVLCSDKTKTCSGCGVCKAACPVGLEMDRCFSAVTQQKKPLSVSEAEYIKKSGSVWGCDICQNVCPYNTEAKNTDIKEFISGYRDEYIIGEEIVGRAYAWRGPEVINRNAAL